LSGNKKTGIIMVNLIGKSLIHTFTLRILNRLIMKKMELTMLVEKGENGYYVGQIQEYPPVMSQGQTIDELEENLKDALKFFLEVQKD